MDSLTNDNDFYANLDTLITKRKHFLASREAHFSRVHEEKAQISDLFLQNEQMFVLLYNFIQDSVFDLKQRIQKSNNASNALPQTECTFSQFQSQADEPSPKYAPPATTRNIPPLQDAVPPKVSLKTLTPKEVSPPKPSVHCTGQRRTRPVLQIKNRSEARLQGESSALGVRSLPHHSEGNTSSENDTRGGVGSPTNLPRSKGTSLRPPFPNTPMRKSSPKALSIAERATDATDGKRGHFIIHDSLLDDEDDSGRFNEVSVNGNLEQNDGHAEIHESDEDSAGVTQPPAQMQLKRHAASDIPVSTKSEPEVAIPEAKRFQDEPKISKTPGSLAVDVPSSGGKSPSSREFRGSSREMSDEITASELKTPLTTRERTCQLSSPSAGPSGVRRLKKRRRKRPRLSLDELKPEPSLESVLNEDAEVDDEVHGVKSAVAQRVKSPMRAMSPTKAGDDLNKQRARRPVQSSIKFNRASSNRKIGPSPTTLRFDGFKTPEAVDRAVRQIKARHQEKEECVAKETVRGDARKALVGHECHECAPLINAEAANDPDPVARKQQLLKHCRHRAKKPPPATPENYWKLTFDDTPTQPPSQFPQRRRPT